MYKIPPLAGDIFIYRKKLSNGIGSRGNISVQGRKGLKGNGNGICGWRLPSIFCNCLSDSGKCLCFEFYYRSSHRVPTQTSGQLGGWHGTYVLPIAGSQANHPFGGEGTQQRMGLVRIRFFFFLLQRVWHSVEAAAEAAILNAEAALVLVETTVTGPEVTGI